MATSWRPQRLKIQSALTVQSTPTGLIAVISSFLLFGLGTLAALTRQRWRKAEND